MINEKRFLFLSNIFTSAVSTYHLYFFKSKENLAISQRFFNIKELMQVKIFRAVFSIRKRIKQAIVCRRLYIVSLLKNLKRREKGSEYKMDLMGQSS